MGAVLHSKMDEKRQKNQHRSRCSVLEGGRYCPKHGRHELGEGIPATTMW